MDTTGQITGSLRRSLARALKRLFRSVHFNHADHTLDFPVEIIRKDVSRMSYLSRISVVSSFPDFEDLELGNDGMLDNTSGINIPFEASQDAQAAQKRLLPAKSLSHLNLRGVFADHSKMPDPISKERGFLRAIKLDDYATTGAVVPQRPSLVPKRSNLQIRRHGSIHTRISNEHLAESSETDSSSSVIRRTKRSSDLRKCAKVRSAARETQRLTPIAENSPSVAGSSPQDFSSHLVRHFASFCVIDILSPGCPVSAVSDDLRYLYDVKDRFVLNAQECTQLSMDLSIGRDPEGNEVTYVLLFSPLVSPATGKSRFVLVSAIDVSGYVRYAASLGQRSESRELETLPSTLNEHSGGRRTSSSISWIDERTDQLADDLLKGCSIPNTSSYDHAILEGQWPSMNFRPSGRDAEDVWTTIAREEGLPPHQTLATTRSTEKFHPGSGSQREATSSASPQSPLDYTDEKVLGIFIESLQVLYSQYFLLACSPLNDQFYEISYVSPAVYASGEYVLGHLSHTSADLIRDFGAHLKRGGRFRAPIRWGDEGLEKQLFCVPLMGPKPAPWICFLVDKDTPIQW